MEMNIEFYRDEPQASVSKTIRDARRNMGYTQAYVADCIHMSSRQYVKYENGQLPIGEISFQQGVNLCELLHIQVYELVEPIAMAMKKGKTSA